MPVQLLDAVQRAVDCYHSEDWQRVLSAGMNGDYSWDVSAGRYEELYRRAIRFSTSEPGSPG
jgi:starch synthase